MVAITLAFVVYVGLYARDTDQSDPTAHRRAGYVFVLLAVAAALVQTVKERKSEQKVVGQFSNSSFLDLYTGRSPRPYAYCLRVRMPMKTTC